MNETLQVSIPLDLDNVRDNGLLKQIIADTVIQNEKEFYPLMERVIDTGDSRISILEGSLHVESDNVTLEKGQHGEVTGGTLELNFESYAYYGCKDMDGSDFHDESLEFRIQDNSLIFDIKLPPAWRPDLYDM